MLKEKRILEHVLGEIATATPIGKMSDEELKNYAKESAKMADVDLTVAEKAAIGTWC